MKYKGSYEDLTYRMHTYTELRESLANLKVYFFELRFSIKIFLKIVYVSIYFWLC